MKNTNDKSERAEQKTLLKSIYKDYIATRHDGFVARYNTDIDKAAFEQYKINRNI
jgi:hypothetical protein